MTEVDPLLEVGHLLEALLSASSLLPEVDPLLETGHLPEALLSASSHLPSPIQFINHNSYR